jgi:hypothetical protein
MPTRTFLAACSLLAVALAGCAGESVGPNPGTKRLRVVNGNVALGPVDVWIGSRRVAAGLPFTGQSVPVAVPSGPVDWAVTRPGEATPVATGRVSLAADGSSTLLLAGTSQTPLATVAKEDSRLPGAGKFRVRFADLRSGALPVDVSAVTPGVELPEVEILAQGLVPGRASQYVDVPEGEFSLLVTAAGNPLDVVLDRPDQSKGGKVFSLYLADPAPGGREPLLIQVGELP